MNNCEICIINLKKDYGRYLSSQNIIKVFGGNFIEAYDCNKINKNGYLEILQNSNVYTQSAKQTKREILQNFYNKSNKDYILIFEDDIYLHNDLFTDQSIIFNQINSFISKKKPKLLYLGISKEFRSSYNNTSHLKFVSFVDKFDTNIKLCSGAYGFMLRKDMIPYVLLRIDNPTFSKNPFDIYCLSYISYTYPDDSYVIEPQLVVPDISHSNIRKNYNQDLMWNILGTNMTNYYIPIIGILYSNVINIESFEHFNKSINCITPIIKIIYYGKKVKNTEIYDTLEIAKRKKIYSSDNIICHIHTNTNIKIKHYSGEKIINLIVSNKSCKNLKIFNNDNNELFHINYLNSTGDEQIITEDL